ncbi:hypothetical protein [Massilia sp. GCM10023247]|uniref:hypothetical protein n=1 Tax=Massilia sp. GCM10023247 TaxID=3252643 RepID=UPI003609457B
MKGPANRSAHKKPATKARDLGLLGLASALAVFVGLALTQAILACVSSVGYELSGSGAGWLRVIVLALCVGWGQRFAIRRFGIKL